MQRTQSSKKAPSPAQFWPPKLLEQQLLRVLRIPAGHRNLDDSLHICLNVYYSKTSPCYAGAYDDNEDDDDDD